MSNLTIDSSVSKKQRSNVSTKSLFNIKTLVTQNLANNNRKLAPLPLKKSEKDSSFETITASISIEQKSQDDNNEIEVRPSEQVISPKKSNSITRKSVWEIPTLFTSSHRADSSLFSSFLIFVFVYKQTLLVSLICLFFLLLLLKKIVDLFFMNTQRKTSFAKNFHLVNRKSDHSNHVPPLPLNRSPHTNGSTASSPYKKLSANQNQSTRVDSNSPSISTYVLRF